MHDPFLLESSYNLSLEKSSWADQVKQLFIVKFQEGYSHCELHLMHVELIKEVVNTARDDAG